MKPAVPSQWASIPQGSGNAIIQIVGRGNTIISGQPYLRLTRYLSRRTVREELDLLSPYTLFTPLIGREYVLGQSWAFLIDSRPVLARCMTGGAGRGKTRFALELCEQASGAGWDAGFVTRFELRHFLQQDLANFGWKRPTLVVIDYAALHVKGLADWIEELSERTDPSGPPLRLLLLERQASLQSGWCAQVFGGGGYGDSAKRALLDPLDPIELEPLQSDEERLSLIQSLLERIDPGRANPAPIKRAELHRKLHGLEWAGDPLYLLMTALTYAQSGRISECSFERTDLAISLARREAKRIGNLAEQRNLDRDLATHLVSCVTLLQGMGREDFMALAKDEKRVMKQQSGGDAAILAGFLEQALAGREGIAPILPDLIGEAFVLTCFENDLGEAAVLRCYAARNGWWRRR